MSLTYETILNILYLCTENLNKQLGEDAQLICSPKTIVVGRETLLDSFSLVMLIVDIEEQLAASDIDCQLMDAIMALLVDDNVTLTIGDVARLISDQQFESSGQSYE